MSTASPKNIPASGMSRMRPEAPDRLIRLPEVMERVGLRRSAIYQRMREGSFPRSRSLGSRCAVWIETEIDDWIQNVRDQ